MDKYLKFVSDMFGNVTVAYAIYAGFSALGAASKDGLKKHGESVESGLKGHMSSENAGKQFGEAAFSAFKAKFEHSHHHFAGEIPQGLGLGSSLVTRRNDVRAR
mmetsp:Transcript_27628/g.60475  ORF Transcript_27628/g.60475 Transcript_27628/m.60475 type:complete len:104 (-) Transcript_27628:413-724(-)|eukprot:CAMPEP_0202889954 /NCGR_PEP_ID=MMETSP1392-20130828/484_1 /ASSEMBLY_ACC=CAM_ASM_000868 /TAXON_ID=225041 /ORGANISM="Chlamydomonas chlamydogama, Strain SAG 11-48b" /LENGTH=103 /DNA_ID=CAMNT_0049573409 /DNA_START=555 /DNA_END=866 /DNA_ORIENTATION=+